MPLSAQSSIHKLHAISRKASSAIAQTEALCTSVFPFFFFFINAARVYGYDECIKTVKLDSVAQSPAGDDVDVCLCVYAAAAAKMCPLIFLCLNFPAIFRDVFPFGQQRQHMQTHLGARLLNEFMTPLID
jgi:hypothetical protein